MTQVGLFFGTTTGKTANIAEMIQDGLGGADVVSVAEIHEVEENSELLAYDCLIIGCPTWDIGELQSDWDTFFPNLDSIDFSGKKVAYFGTGDQIGYADNFMDAMGILEAKISEKGGTTVGQTSTEGYEFESSKAVKDGQFCGLAIDEDNQDDFTDERVSAWITQLKSEFGL
ncbi:MAG: flavodoxin FldA [Cyanobacteria bacterium P01_A01_bin.17]